jgi:hypothetical protein
MGELPQASGVPKKYMGSVWVKGSPETRRARRRAYPCRAGFRMSGKRQRGECLHSPRDWLETVVQGWFKAGV